MAHFAQLDENNIVVNVIVVPDEYDGRELEYSAETGKTYKQTSYNTHYGIYYIAGTADPHPDQTKALRKNYAGYGYKYMADIDAFVPPKPYESWVLNVNTGQWDPPIPAPANPVDYDWDEETKSWVPRKD